METNETEVLDSTSETEVAETAEVEPKEDIDALKKEIETLKVQKEKWREKANKPTEKIEATPQNESLSNTDIIYLAKADIHDEDMNELLDWAKFKKITVKEAHKQLKGTLDVRAEQRRTAEATQTGRTQRGTTKVLGEDLLIKAETTGEVPETEEGMRALFMARQARKSR